MNGSVWDNFIEIFIGDEEEDNNSTNSSAQRYMMKTIPYYFLRDELGISDDKMLKISLNFGQVLALSVERSMRPKVAWLQSALKLSRAEVAYIIERTPTILLCSLEDSLEPKLRWLYDELGLSGTEARRVIMQCPPILASSAGGLLLKVDYLSDELGLSMAQIKRVVTAMPTILILSTDNIAEKIDFLREEMGLTDEAVPALLVKAPAIVFQNLDTTLRRRVRFLRRHLGLTSEELGRILLRTPRVFNFDIEARAKPFVLYLTRSPFKFRKDQVKRLLMHSPSLLGINVSSRRFLETIEALKAALGVTEKELSSLLLAFPPVLSLTAERIWSTSQLLNDTLGCDRNDFKQMLQRHPQVLGYRLESMRAKLSAICEIYEVGPQELRPIVVHCPWLLSYSQAARLEPRLRAARDVGLPLDRAVALVPYAEARFDAVLVQASTVEMDLRDTPLLKQHPRLRKLLRLPRGEAEKQGGGEGGGEAKEEGRRKRGRPRKADQSPAPPKDTRKAPP